MAGSYPAIMFESMQLALAKMTISLLAMQIAIAAIPSATYVIEPPQHLTAAQVYAKVPILYRAAACESTGDPNGTPRQFNDDGSILWGHDPKLWNLTGATTTDVGELQISLYWHGDEVKKLGLDVINSEDDNVYYGYVLFERGGLSNWKPSKGCWKG